MTRPYIPIACALHDEYEIAVMRKKPLCIKWLDENNQRHTEKVFPKDVMVKNKEEFLVAIASDNTERCIRLDRINRGALKFEKPN